jgi:tetratricopeptide (TPR) repeat protein
LFSATVTTLGAAYAQCGRVDEAVSLLEQAAAGAARGRFHARALSLIALGDAYLSAGRREDAGACTNRALRLAQDHHERGNEAWALRLLGEIAARAEPAGVGHAEDHYRQALALAEELGMRPLVAHGHLGLGSLYQKIGREEEAQAELALAAQLYRAMEMISWLDKAEAALAQAAS